MRGDTSIFLSFLDQILSADFLSIGLVSKMSIFLVFIAHGNEGKSNEVYILSGPSMKYGRPEAHPSLS